MANLAIAAKPSAVSSYIQLRTKVRETLLEGQQKIEQQKVMTYWETGKSIHEHILLQEKNDSGNYGKEVVEKLAEDLNVSAILVYQCLQFYRAYKNLYARIKSIPLSWAHLRATARISNESKRFHLLEKAMKREWTSRELEIEVRNHNWSERIAESNGKKLIPLPPVKLGPFHTYQIVRPETIHEDRQRLLLDCGFSLKKELDFIEGTNRFEEGTLVTSVKTTRGYQLKKVSQDPKLKTDDLLYTYKAYVVNVIDGDTLKLDFRLGFGDRKGEIIRLNHIDCPEMNTPEGKAAKRFVQFQLSGCDFITVKSIRTRKEKWGRYLGDVFYKRKDGEPIYLNQLLLDKGHAVRVRK